MPTIDDIRRNADETAAMAESRLVELLDQRDVLEAEIREIRAIARHYQRPVPSGTNGSAKKKPPSASKKYAGKDTITSVAGAVTAFGDGDRFTARGVAQLLPGMHESSVRNGLVALRDREAIRAAEREREGTGRIPSQFYRIMDRDILESLANNGHH